MHAIRPTALMLCAGIIWTGSACRADTTGGATPAISMLNSAAGQPVELKSWSLPINASLQPLSGASKKSPRREYKGEISADEGEDPMSAKLDQLLDMALKRSADAQRLNEAVAHYRKPSRKALANTLDAVEYMIPYNGFASSSEAGDIILDEKLKVKSLASAEFARQKQIDQLHVQLVSGMMQIAMGLGSGNEARGQAFICEGSEQLQNLIGEEETAKTVEAIKAWSHNLQVPESIYQQDTWSVKQQQHKLQTVLNNALDSDPVVRGVTKALHKYNHQSKLKRTTGKVVETTLGIAAFTPTLVGTAAQVGLMAFMLSTGGPEQDKLLKELYLDKRLQSRANALNQKANLALANYQTAVLTRNPVLLAFSEMLISDMSGPETAGTIFCRSVLAPDKNVNLSAMSDEDATSFLHMENPPPLLLPN